MLSRALPHLLQRVQLAQVHAEIIAFQEAERARQPARRLCHAHVLRTTDSGICQISQKMPMGYPCHYVGGDDVHQGA